MTTNTLKLAGDQRILLERALTGCHHALSRHIYRFASIPRGPEALDKVLYDEAPPRIPTPYSVLN